MTHVIYHICLFDLNNKMNFKLFDSKDIENIYNIEMRFWEKTRLCLDNILDMEVLIKIPHLLGSLHIDL